MARHFQQDAVNLRHFFVEQPHQFVVLVDGLQGLDKDGLPAGTGSVNHALHTALLLDLDRNHEALAADRDQLILHRAAFGQSAQIASERLLDRPLLPFDLAPDSRQFRRSAVFERAVRLDLVAKAAQEFGEVDNPG